MLPRSRRIPRSLFASLENGRKYGNSRFFSVRTGLSKTARVGVTVSKKISKSAVVRNTIRRRVYSVVSEIIPSLRPGLFLIIALPGAEKIKGDALKREIRSLLGL